MTITLKALKREVFGKKIKSAETAGNLPAVIYGYKQEATPLFINTIEFKRALNEAGESSVVSLVLEEGKARDVLIHEVQYHPISGEPIHADFYAVQQDKKIEVEVELVFEGVPPAVKELGGNLVKVMHVLPVEALPKDLPSEIIVDVSGLTTIDGQILVKDIKLPTGVTAMAEPEEVVASITEAGETVVEEAAPVDLNAIEVEKKGKKEEEDEAESEG